MSYAILMQDGNYLSHHGVLGQKWGVRRYQNPDGTLTDVGRKRMYKTLHGSGKVTIANGEEINRVSGKRSSDAKTMDKTYVTVGSEEKDKFISLIGTPALRRTGEAWCHKYLTKNDIKIPSIHVQKKMERQLLKDPDVKKEVFDSLVSIGYSEKMAEKFLSNHSVGKEFATMMLTSVAAGSAAGAVGAIGTATGPLGFLGFAGAGAATVSLRLLPDIVSYSKELDTAITKAISNSFGNIENIKLNSAYTKLLEDKGYNAFRDFNDRLNPNIKSKTAIVMTNPDRDLKMLSATKLTKQEYVDSALRNIREQKDFKNMTDDQIKKIFGDEYDSAIKDYSESKKGK